MFAVTPIPEQVWTKLIGIVARPAFVLDVPRRDNQV